MARRQPAPAVRVRRHAHAVQGEGHQGHVVERHPDLQGVGRAHRLRDAARHLHGRRRHARPGQVLRRPARQGARDAGVEGVHGETARSTRPRMVGKEYADWVAKAETLHHEPDEGSGLPRAAASSVAPRAPGAARGPFFGTIKQGDASWSSRTTGRSARCASWERSSRSAFFVFGAVVVWDSRRLGSAWASDGPQAGYFPFYIGLHHLHRRRSRTSSRRSAQGAKGAKAFVMWGQLKMVLTVMVPCVVYVALIANPVYSLGIYEASAIFIAFFMRYLGKYAWPKIAAVSIGVMVAFFLMFEVWFKVPLPKGPHRSPARLPLGTRAHARDPIPDRRLRRRPDVVQPDADARRREPRRADRRAAGPGRRQRRGDPAAAHVLDGAAAGRRHLGDHPAVVHLLGRALRRRHHLDPVQHPGRAVVGGDHLRRLSDGAEGRGGQALTAAFTSSFIGALVAVVDDHVPVAARRALRAASSGRRSSSRSTCSPSAPSSAWPRARPSRPSRR